MSASSGSSRAGTPLVCRLRVLLLTAVRVQYSCWLGHAMCILAPTTDSRLSVHPRPDNRHPDAWLVCQGGHRSPLPRGTNCGGVRLVRVAGGAGSMRPGCEHSLLRGNR